MEDETHAGKDSLKKCGSEAGIAFSPGGGFDCNICLEFAADPVVTLCGHLYCWPCIYKWLQRSVNTFSQRCPVCKAVLSQDTLVPLYGHGNSSESKISHQNVNIPHRPSFHRESIDSQAASVIMRQYPLNGPHNSQLQHGHQQEYPYVNSSSDDYMLPYPTLGTTRVFQSTAVGLLAGMAVDFLPLIFRNHQFSGMYYSPYYPTDHGRGLGHRRQELEVQRALHRIWVFLFCCAILCLLLF